MGKGSECKLNGVQQTVARITAEVVQNILALIVEDKVAAVICI